MTSEVCDTEEDDSAELEALLAELEEDGRTSRYDNHHSSSSSHAETHSDTSIIMHTQEKGAPPLSINHDKVEESGKAIDAKSMHLRAPCEEKASDAHSAHLCAAADPLNNTMDYMPPISPPEPSHVHQCETHAFAVERPPSPPPGRLCGCTCFLLPSHKRAEKQKKYSKAAEQRNGDGKAGNQQAMAPDKDGSSNSGSQDMDAGGLFDVQRTEKEFKRASKKEKQLTQEAQKFLKTVATV